MVPPSLILTHLVTAEQSTRFAMGEYVYAMQVRTSHTPAKVRTVIEAAPWSVCGDVTGCHELPQEIEP